MSETMTFPTEIIDRGEVNKQKGKIYGTSKKMEKCLSPSG